MTMRSRIAAVCCTFAATLLAATPEPQLEELDEVLVTAKVAAIRLEDFVEFPKYDSVVISPSGRRVAMGWIDGNFQRQMNILEVPSLKPVANYTLAAHHSLSELQWAGEDRLLLQIHWPLRAFRRLRGPIGVISLNDIDGGNPYNINIESTATTDPFGQLLKDQVAWESATRELVPSVGDWPGRNALGPVRMIETGTGEPGMLLFQTSRTSDRRGSGEGYGAFQLDLRNNRQTRVATLPVPGGQFITGPDHRVALAVGVNAKNQSVVYYLPQDVRADGRDWQLVASSEARGIRPVGWTGNGEEYFALDGRSALTTAVVAWNPANNTQRVLYRHPGVDMDAVAFDPAGKPWMFSGTEFFPVYWYPDPAHPLARLHQVIARKVQGETVEIVNASDDLAVAVVRVSAGRRPPVYLIVDVATGNSMTGLFTYPTLRGTRLSQVDPIEFRARDGLVIRGYLTTPEDGAGKPRTGLPLLVVAHDGPLGEPAGPAYEYERQLLASRGYAVLQVNRRGSPGRGAEFERAGDGKWGREVQDDFVDGVRWAIKDGVADPQRICFYGSGYGAYSAMVAAAKEPTLFKCVIGVAGAFDLPRLLGEGKTDIPPDLAQVLGKDMEELKARSPVSLAASIKAKVLLIPQERDEYFPPEQSNRMRTALKDAGNSAQNRMIGQEYDGLHIPTTRANGYQEILRFLNQQIGR